MGYAGDEFSQATRNPIFSVSATYGFPGEGAGYWVLMIFISNNVSTLNYIPIPGVSYIYRGSSFSGIFGFPLTSFQWTPVEPWALAVSLFGLNAQAEVDYGHLEQFQVFAGHSFNQENFIPTVRSEDDYRLTIQDQKADIGMRIPLANRALLEFRAGRGFTRSIYIGHGFLNKDGGELALSSDWFGAGTIKCTF